MPKELHDKLAREARKRGLKGKRFNAYVYGTLNKIESQRKGGGKLVKHLAKS